MSKFNPKDLKISLKNGVNVTEPIEGRKYTLTHSDETGELFLTIGKEYDNDSIDYNIRDEVLGVWEKKDKCYLVLSVLVDNGDGILNSVIRDKIFREELPLAILAIVYGDNLLLENNKELYNAPIIIKFNSSVKEYNVIEQWGSVKDYSYIGKRADGENSNFNFVPNQKAYPFPGPIPIVPQPIPIPSPYPNPYPNDNKGKGKNKIIEDALLAVLDRYIRSEVFTLFGRDALYCLKRAEVLQARIINTYGPCSEQYEVTIGLRVGKNAPFYNNMIITFIIDDRVIKVKNVKNPREI